MPFAKPKDLLIECRACKIENLVGDYTPELPIVCSQCRERLIDLDLEQTHKEYVCDDCGMSVLLFKETEITAGESTCRCGSTRLTLLDSPETPKLADKAGAFAGDSGDTNDVEDFDWCRPSPNESISEDYNDVFDNDPSF